MELKELNRAGEISPDPASTLHEAILIDGESEVHRSAGALAVSGLAAGLAMGFSLLIQATLHHYLPHADWTHLVTKLGYTIGFLIVVLGKQELFTENTLSPVIPWLSRKSKVNFKQVLRLWAIVLAANLVGAFIIALAIAKLEVVEPAMRESLRTVGMAAYKGGHAGPLFIQAILAGWLIATMAWLVPAAEQGRLWIVAIFAYAVGVGNFPHVVAGTIEVLYASFDGPIPIANVFTNYVFPVLIGNTIGGVVLVAGLNHAQVRLDDDDDHEVHEENHVLVVPN